MKKFINKVMIFILPILIVSFIADYGLSGLLRQSANYHGEIEVWNDIYSSKANCQLAIYGSSRAWVQIDPAILKDSLKVNTYNFGIDGHNFWLQYLRHLELLKYNDKPDEIVISVDPLTLQKRPDLYEADQFLPYMLWNNNIFTYTRTYRGYSFFEYYLPIIRYAGKHGAIKESIRLLLNQNLRNESRKKGFAANDRHWNNEFEMAKKQHPFYLIKFDLATINLFEKFINECRRMNIRLILVYTPEYIDGQKFIINRDKALNLFKSMALKYEINFLNYSNDSICYNKSFFYNTQHLNMKGSGIFSKKLAHDLKSIRLNLQSNKNPD